MSVFGVDFGNLNSTVAITRYGGVDVVTNEVSKRETTTIVSFLKDERFIGEQGLDRYVRNAQNTIFLIKRFIGMRVNDPAFEQEKRFLTCKTSEGKDRRVMFEVNYCDEVIYFYPEQVLAMLLQKLRTYVNQAGTIDARYPADIRDCVITVPAYFNADQRRLMYQAAETAGLHCMSLINESTAAAVDYGIFRGATLKETEAEGQTVGLFDIGYGATSFTVLKFWRGNCRVLSRVYDRMTGTRDFDRALFEHFADEVRTRYHVNVRGNSRAELRLLQACEQVKYLLSANQSAPFNVENLMDIDVNISQFERSTFETIAAPVMQRMRVVVERGLAECGVTAEAFHSVEMIGGGSRIPLVKRIIDDVFHRSPSFTLNASETTARGAAIMAAMLSPKFQVREFKVAELATYPIKLGYQVRNPKSPCVLPFAPQINKCVTLLCTKDHYPKLLDVTVPLTTPFEMTAFYDPESDQVREYVRDDNYIIGEWRVDRPTKKLSSSSATSGSEVEREVKVRVNIRPDGVLYLDTAWAIMVHEEAEPASATDATNNNNNNAANTNADAAEANGASQSQSPSAAEQTAAGRDSGEGVSEVASPADAAPSPTASPASTAEKPVKQRKVIRRQVEVPISAKAITVGHHETDVRNFSKHEGEMFARDDQILRTREKKNELESYILNYRPRLAAGGDLADYITPTDRDAFLALCDADENWLYDDSDGATLADFEDHVQALRRIGDAAEQRRRTREDVAFERNAFTQTIQTARTSALSKMGGNLPHISDEELQTAAATADEALAWAQTQLEQLQQMPKTADPPASFSVKALRERAETVRRGVAAVVNRPAPKPAAPSKSAASSAEASNSSPTSSNNNAPGAAAAASMQNEEECMQKSGSAEACAQAENGQPQHGTEEDEVGKKSPSGEAAGGSASAADNEELD